MNDYDWKVKVHCVGGPWDGWIDVHPLSNALCLRLSDWPEDHFYRWFPESGNANLYWNPDIQRSIQH